ncbi:hypothetical protein CASFOL_028549 [Castilleja foliolosa]|uniref:C2H2-type domain-containing protein n=1 Tax=Castilleja foliolosa TaxID=1961234 RepID=A0ABD3CBJ1_9LAMI
MVASLRSMRIMCKMVTLNKGPFDYINFRGFGAILPFVCYDWKDEFATPNGLGNHFEHKHPEKYKKGIVCHLCLSYVHNQEKLKARKCVLEGFAITVTSLTSRRLKPRRRRKLQKRSSTMPRRPRTPNLLRRLATRLLRLPTTMLGWMKPLRRRKPMMQGGKPRLPLSFSRRSQVTIVTILLILSLTLVTLLIYNFDY